MATAKIFLLPITVVLLLIFTVTVTFFLALKFKHLHYLPPFISDTGAKPPESCIFGQMLNIIAFLVGIVVYVKYRQIKEVLTIYNLLHLQKLNITASWMGYAAALGMTLVANFQETNLLEIHFMGAMLAFGFGALYQCLEFVISQKIRLVFSNGKIVVLKLILSVVSVVTFLVFFVCSFIFLRNFDGSDMTMWKPSDGFATIHLSSILAEWQCVSSIALFILTLAYDFVNVVITEPVVVLRDHFVSRIN